MSIEYKNPFSKYRAEQMGASAWKYFVEPTSNHIGSKPLIFEGSRGTGKTMFFKCNSWGEKFLEAKSNESYFLSKFSEYINIKSIKDACLFK